MIVVFFLFTAKHRDEKKERNNKDEAKIKPEVKIEPKIVSVEPEPTSAQEFSRYNNDNHYKQEIKVVRGNLLINRTCASKNLNFRHL